MRTVAWGRGRRHGWRLLLNEPIGPPECPMMVRWVLQTPIGGLRLHHFLRGDADRDMHDHPWWFATLVVRGSYVDVSEAGRDVLRVGSVRYRPAQHAHWVESSGCWTVVVSGPMGRAWGFITERGWMPWRDYEALHGHPACADDVGAS